MSSALSEDRLSAVYQHTGPFVTVYLDATRSTESGAREVGLRWREVSGELERQGASLPTLAAIEAAITADEHSPGRHGLVVVAADDAVLLAERLRRPPPTSVARVAPLPHLMPYLVDRTTDVAHVVVVTDRTGADVLAVGADRTTTTRTVEGRAQFPLHRTASADWSQRHFQLRVENTWQANARDVARAVSRMVDESDARVVVVAGDLRARHMVAEDVQAALSPGFPVAVVEEGARAAGASAEPLEDAVRNEVLRVVWRDRHAVLEHLAQNLGRAEFATAGAAPVARALRMAAVDTVVISDDPSSTLRAWITQTPSEFGLAGSEVDAVTGAVEHDRYDAALVRAVVATGAKLLITPGAHDYLPEGVGALLRYETGPGE